MVAPLVAALAPAAIAAGASFLGGERANAANAAQARAQMEFQERMSSTSWQRGVDDMRKAGLNPALAYERGGASAPGGAMAQMEDTLSKGVSSGMDAAGLRSRLQSEQVQRVAGAAQADATAASAELTREQARTARMHRMAQLQLMIEQAEGARAGARSAHATANRTANLAPWERNLLEEEFTVGRPLGRELMRRQTELTGASARSTEQSIRLTDRMTPDAWSAWIQRNLLPYVSPLRR